MDRGRENRDGNGLPQGHKKATKIVPLAKKKKKHFVCAYYSLKQQETNQVTVATFNKVTQYNHKVTIYVCLDLYWKK